MTDPLARLRRNYRARFMGYLSRRDESALWSAYELGREGLTSGVSLLDVVQVHHDALVGVLRGASGNDLPDVADAATTFLVEVLAPFEMTRRGFLESSAGNRRPPHPPTDTT